MESPKSLEFSVLLRKLPRKFPFISRKKAFKEFRHPSSTYPSALGYYSRALKSRISRALEASLLLETFVTLPCYVMSPNSTNRQALVLISVTFFLRRSLSLRIRFHWRKTKREIHNSSFWSRFKMGRELRPVLSGIITIMGNSSELYQIG